MKQKFLILYTAVGLGHKEIAMNYQWYLERAGYPVASYNIYEVEGGSTVQAGIFVHKIINTYFPWVWKFLYYYGYKPLMPFRRFTARKMERHTSELLQREKPDIVLCTQTSATAVMANLKASGIFTGKLVVTFSDYHFHPFWVYAGVDYYLCNISDQAEGLKKLGVSESAIAVLGMTLKPKDINTREAEVRKEIRAQNVPVVLCAAGSLGIGLPVSLLRMLSQDTHFRLVVLCGKNTDIKFELEQQLGSSATVLGFYRPMSELYTIAKVIITKPGGLTIAECLQYNITPLITHYLPGQEELNVVYLKSKNLCVDLLGKSSAEVLTEVKTLLFSQNGNQGIIDQLEARYIVNDQLENNRFMQAVDKITVVQNGG